MQDIFANLLFLLIFVLPAYFANSIPVVLGGGTPLDLNFKFSDKKRLFGDGKTIRGFIAGVLMGTLIGELQAICLPSSQFALYPSASNYIIAGFLLGLGTMVGDLAGSFIKRRLGMKQGRPSIILDQLFFLALALAFVYPLAPNQVFEPANLAFLFAFTYVVHVGFNWLANRLGLKNVPW